MMKLTLPLWQHALACLLGIAACVYEAKASGLQVAPVTLTLQGERNADGIWLSNDGDQDINAQVRVYHWSQSDFKDRLLPSQGLVISPPMLALRPGERQLIRVIRTGPVPEDKEDAYRLSVSELPLAAPGKNKLQFVMHYSLPIFIQPAITKPLSAKLAWSVSRIGDGFFLDVYNQGNSHAQLSAATLINSRGVHKVITPGLLGYVLPGSRMRWILPVSAGNFIHGGKLEVTINGQKTEQTL